MTTMSSSHFHLLVLFFFNLHSITHSDPQQTPFISCLQAKIGVLTSTLHIPKSSSYTPILQEYIKNSRFNTSTIPKPIYIATPSTTADVQAVVVCAMATNLQIKIRSGGHDYEGVSYTSIEQNFIVLDMFNFRNISVNVGSRIAYVQAGAQMGELYYNIWKASKTLGFPGGVCPTMGVGGHISGGGYGAMLRKFGLSVDNVVDAELVDANGHVLNRKSMGEDLFWAIRGGGGASFGVILSYTLKLVDVPKIVTVFRVERVLEENATVLVDKWQYIAPNIDNRLFIRLLIQPITRKPYGKTIRASFIALFLGYGQELIDVINKEFQELGVNENNIHEMSWMESVLFLANFANKTTPEILLNRHSDTVGFGKRKSDYFQNPVPKSGLDLIFKKMLELGKVGFVWNPYGGVMGEIPASATPFPHRAGFLWKMQYSINWKAGGAETENEYLNQIRSLYDFMTPYVSNSPRGAFLNYRDLDIGINHNGANSYDEGKVYGEKYFLGNFNRLVKIKTFVDPYNFFRNEQSIPVLKQI
uniref:berberine bridge enzyme-like 21 n=1 Tax=Erigeron canadensis TaxID=72917 RepID=UPI001CB9CD11|nr:berberine bridge enzyme-like 21 [Erigeron canadensis]